jgi:hypothetical protein
MNPLTMLLLIGGGALLLLGKKSTPATTTVAKVPTPIGPVVVTQPTSTGPGAGTSTTTTTPVAIPPIKVTLPSIPTSADYPAQPASGDVSPMLSESEQYAIANYTDDQLYNEGLSSGHLAYVIAIGAKLAADGDTRAADMTLRAANWGK